MNNTELLNHAERVHEEYLELVDKIPTEDKITLSYGEEPFGLEPWEISDIVHHAMSKIPDSMKNDDIDALFDVMYEAVTEAVEKAGG